MGGGGKGASTPKIDTSAQERQAEQARLEAQIAQAKEDRLAEQEREREANVKKSGRKATILAGEEGESTSLLGG